MFRNSWPVGDLFKKNEAAFIWFRASASSANLSPKTGMNQIQPESSVSGFYMLSYNIVYEPNHFWRSLGFVFKSRIWTRFP